MKTDSTFFKIGSEALDFLSTEHEYKRAYKQRSRLEEILYHNYQTSIVLTFDFESQLNMDICKLDGAKPDPHCFYPSIRIEELAEAIDYPLLQYPTEPEQYPLGPDWFPRLLADYADVLRSEKHRILDGDFSAPAQVKEYIERSERWVDDCNEYREKHAQEFQEYKLRRKKYLRKKSLRPDKP